MLMVFVLTRVKTDSFYLCFNNFVLYLICIFMPSSGSKSPSPHRNRKKSKSSERKKGSRDNRSPSSSSRSSHSSRDRHKSNARRSRSPGEEKPREYNRYPPRREVEPVPQNLKLFVTNIDSKFSQQELDRDIRALFEPFGKIKDVVIKTKQGSANSYAFVEYDDVQSAVKALETLKGRDFKGKELKVEYGRGERKFDDRRSDKCYICHKEGHFAKDCKYNQFNQSRDRFSSDYRRNRSPQRPERHGRDRYDDGYRRHRRDSRSRSPSSSDSRRSYRRRHDRDRDDYKRRDSRRSPQRRSDYYSRRH